MARKDPEQRAAYQREYYERVVKPKHPRRLGRPLLEATETARRPDDPAVQEGFQQALGWTRYMFGARTRQRLPQEVWTMMDGLLEQRLREHLADICRRFPANVENVGGYVCRSLQQRIRPTINRLATRDD